MPSRTLRRIGAIAPLTALLTTTAVFTGPASALDDAKPVYTCGLFVKDSDKDSAEPNSVPAGASHANMEIKGFFLKHEPAKGAEATTVNIIVKDLNTTLPSGNTAINWTMKYTFDGTERFVRAVADYSGGTAFEWGEYTATGLPAGVSGTFQYRGGTPGKLFEGPDGVVQLVLPPDVGGKAGSALSGLDVSANTGKSVVPVAATTPSRGVAYQNDNAIASKWTVETCVAGTGALPGTTAPGTGTGTAPGTTPSGPSQTTGPTALPVKLLSSKAKAPKSKALALKLSSTEKITGLVAQLRQGSRTVGKGKLASISGKATLKLKLSRKLKKGKYLLDLVGKDAQGQQRSTTASLTLKN